MANVLNTSVRSYGLVERSVTSLWAVYRIQGNTMIYLLQVIVRSVYCSELHKCTLLNE